MNQLFLRRCLRFSTGMLSIPQDLFGLNEFINFLSHRALLFHGGCCSSLREESWPLASTRCSWFSSHRSWRVKQFSERSEIALAFSIGWYLRPKGPFTVVRLFGPFLFLRDFTIGHKAWGLTSQFSIFPPNHSSSFLHSSNGFSDSVNCRLTGWIPGFMPQFS
jgi:hypothetical protein